jgi:D-beta-D-heptose 7-phosphate kinase/D-beta-D-heptose 1-phosphate adenosyltransferase
MKRIFVNGTFDIIHPGHLELLYFAKTLGDHLLVALDTDERVKKLKGPTRPINNLKTRKLIMNSFKPVNCVLSFSSDEELANIIKKYEPDVMVVGSDYKNKPVIGSEYAKRVMFFERIEEYSSTKVIEKIKNEHTLRSTDL